MNNGAFNNRHDNYRANNNEAQEVRIDITEEVVTKKNLFGKAADWVSTNKKLAGVLAGVALTGTVLLIFRKKIVALFKKKGEVTVKEIKEAVEEAQAEAEACKGKKK